MVQRRAHTPQSSRVNCAEFSAQSSRKARVGSGKSWGRGSGKIQGIKTPSHVYKHVNEQGKSGGNYKNSNSFKRDSAGI